MIVFAASIETAYMTNEVARAIPYPCLLAISLILLAAMWHTIAPISVPSSMGIVSWFVSRGRSVATPPLPT